MTVGLVDPLLTVNVMDVSVKIPVGVPENVPEVVLKLIPTADKAELLPAVME